MSRSHIAASHLHLKPAKPESVGGLNFICVSDISARLLLCCRAATRLEHGDIRKGRHRNADPCTAAGCKWLKSGAYVYVPVTISSSYSKWHQLDAFQSLYTSKEGVSVTLVATLGIAATHFCYDSKKSRPLGTEASTNCWRDSAVLHPSTRCPQIYPPDHKCLINKKFFLFVKFSPSCLKMVFTLSTKNNLLCLYVYIPTNYLCFRYFSPVEGSVCKRNEVWVWLVVLFFGFPARVQPDNSAAPSLTPCCSSTKTPAFASCGGRANATTSTSTQDPGRRC